MGSPVTHSTPTSSRERARVLRFVSRAEQRRLRGQRNYSRYMRITKGLVDADGPERAQWHRESAEESVRDAEWKRRHDPVPGGARVLLWHRDERALDQPASVPRSTPAEADIR